MTDTELIKSKIDIVDFLSEYIQLKKAGRNFKALCPFHSEKTPSFIVSPERGSWHCFGACSEGGDIISFLQKWENIEFVEALKILAKRAGVTLSSYTQTDSSRLKEKLYEINHLASEFYHFLLTSHKLGERARDYLTSRKITPQTIKTFSLGYAPDSWESLSRFLTKKGYETSDIFSTGLLVKSETGRFYDRFRGRLIFTLRDHRGNVIGFSGRKLAEDKDLPAGRSEAKYINTSETPIYRKGETLYGMDVTREAIKKEKEAVVVEGEFDVLSSFQAGVTNVVAIKGSALTSAQVLLLKRITENLVLALDSDFAGSEAARRGIEIADSLGLTVRVVRLLSGKDPAECIEKGVHLWKKSVKESIPVFDFIIDTALSNYDKEAAIGKKKIGDEVVPVLSKITNPIVLSHYTRRLSKELGVAEESIEAAVSLFQKKLEKKETIPMSTSHALRDELLEEHLLSLIVQSRDPFESLESAMQVLELSDFKMPAVKKIIEQLSAYFTKQKKFDIKKFSPSLTSELSPTFDRAYMVDIGRLLSQRGVFLKELIRTVKEVKKEAVRRRVGSLSTKIRQSEDENKETEIKLMNEELRQLLKIIAELEKSSDSRLQ